MCAIRGTKLYGLRIKKNSQSKNIEQKNFFKGFNFKFKNVGIKFG